MFDNFEIVFDNFENYPLASEKASDNPNFALDKQNANAPFVTLTVLLFIISMTKCHTFTNGQQSFSVVFSYRSAAAFFAKSAVFFSIFLTHIFCQNRKYGLQITSEGQMRIRVMSR